MWLKFDFKEGSRAPSDSPHRYHNHLPVSGLSLFPTLPAENLSPWIPAFLAECGRHSYLRKSHLFSGPFHSLLRVGAASLSDKDVPLLQVTQHGRTLFTSVAPTMK